MATLSVQDVNTTGATPSFAAATSGGDQFSNDGKTMLEVKSAGAAVTVTIASQVTCNQGSTHNQTVTVSSGGDKMIGPFDPNRFNDTSGYVQITYSQVTAITVGAFQI
jgi:hypothetical protein